MSAFKDKVWQEILDGKRDWKVPAQTHEAFDLFEAEFVRPLQELRDEGRIKTYEVKQPIPGTGIIAVSQIRLTENPRFDDE